MTSSVPEGTESSPRSAKKSGRLTTGLRDLCRDRDKDKKKARRIVRPYSIGIHGDSDNVGSSGHLHPSRDFRTVRLRSCLKIPSGLRTAAKAPVGVGQTHRRVARGAQQINRTRTNGNAQSSLMAGESAGEGFSAPASSYPQIRRGTTRPSDRPGTPRCTPARA